MTWLDMEQGLCWRRSTAQPDPSAQHIDTLFLGVLEERVRPSTAQHK